jgi:uncharacterized protein (TIGR02246 family)
MKRPEEMAEEFQKAWNSHEMAALASLFCEDATFVNRFGHYVRGVQEIVSLRNGLWKVFRRSCRFFRR